ncbi:MAG: beta-CASP ribonuclease aCPSF1 [Candidatus Methanomethylophilaceae archaeon]|nr:beta-CASP ribonuclease aCPSF1 [Candidatus Methanomethylophilaceae archaeon]
MNTDRLFESLREQVRRIVPPDINISSIEFEGPEVVIYTKELEKFAGNNLIIKKLAQGLRRRIAVRPDPSMLANPDEVEAKIREMVPAEAEIVDIFFEHDTGEVTIEAIAPGIVIGKHGALLNEIKKEVGWAPKVVRAPPIPSKAVSDVRNYLRQNHDQRKEFLKKVGRKIARPTLDGENWIRMTALGGFRQVGRSATLLQTRESRILIDCGMDPSNGEASPYFSVPEMQPLDSIDAVVITHAHLDHCGLLPVLYKYGYDGPIYCTAPTRDLMSILLIDSLKVSYGEARKSPFDSSHIRDAVMHTIPLKYGETTDISPDIRLTFQNAGHILGSAVSHFHIGDGLHNIAFTGDMKFEKTWLFNATNNRFPRLETLVIESTYGGHSDFQPSRVDASKQMREVLIRAMEKGGKVLIPVFAVGRSQEVMLVIEEMVRSGKLDKVPVYLDGMIWEATAIHTAYPEYLNSQLRTQIFQQGENPFLNDIFKRVDSQSMREEICHSPDPCIVLATAGMMNGGPVLEYFKAWADNPINWLLFVGYQSEGSIGRQIQRGRKEITMSEKGTPINLNIRINTETIDGFSGHSDRRQLMNYISSLDPKPDRIIIGHGEDRKCTDLASSLYKKFNIETRAPQNLETVRLR